MKNSTGFFSDELNAYAFPVRDRQPIRRLLLGASALALAALPCAALAQQAKPVAATILTGGQIYTDNSTWSQAMAIGSNGVILAVGDAAAMTAFKGPATKMVDLKGDAVLPGLHDMHLHPLGGGMRYTDCVLKRGATPAELRTIIKACAATKKPGEWIVGGSWVADVFKDEVQDKTLLDEAAPNNPVILSDETGHSTWANSMAMKIGGIDRNTPNPLNGVIEHDAKGEPTGLFRESGSTAIRAKIPAKTAADNEQAMRRAYQDLLGYGITTIQDASGGVADAAAHAGLYDKGQPAPRVKVCMRWAYNISGVDPGFEALYAQRSLYQRPTISMDCVKIVNDGVPGEGHTAAMLEPYADVIPGDKDDSRKFGIMNTPPEVLKSVVTRFDKAGLSMLIHCTGDACARAAVDAVEVARKTNGFTGLMHQVGHSNFNTAADLARGKTLGVSFEYSAYLYYWAGTTRVYFKAIGPERFKRYKPLRESIDAGAVTIEGSDWPVSESANPWIAIETLVTRLAPGVAAGDRLAPAEAITLKEAIDVYTVNPAKQFGHAGTVGLIKPGYLADVIVLDRNPFTVPITDVHNTKVKATLVGGKLASGSLPQ